MFDIVFDLLVTHCHPGRSWLHRRVCITNRAHTWS